MKHVLNEKYNSEKGKTKYPTNKIVSSSLNKVFSDMWRDDLGVSRRVVDIAFFTKSLGRWFTPSRRHDAGEMLRFVIQRLIDEEIPLRVTANVLQMYNRDGDVEKYYNSCKTSKMF